MLCEGIRKLLCRYPLLYAAMDIFVPTYIHVHYKLSCCAPEIQVITMYLIIIAPHKRGYQDFFFYFSMKMYVVGTLLSGVMVFSMTAQRVKIRSLMCL